MQSRSILDRFVSLCFGICMGCLFVYLGVQLIRAVLIWLIVGGLIVGAVVLLISVFRWRRERW